MTRKVNKIKPFFYEIKVINKEIWAVAHVDFATQQFELDGLKEQLKKRYPAPMYKIAVHHLESIGEGR